MTSEAQQLLKLIDGHIESVRKNSIPTDGDLFHLGGLKSIRWLVYNFFNAPRPIKDHAPDMEEVVKTALTVGQGVARVSKDENGNLVIKHVEPDEHREGK